jgi:thiamine-phosphate diphosphorylase
VTAHPPRRIFRESAGVGGALTRILPENAVLLLTDRRQARRSLVDVVTAAVEGGARYVVLREKDLPRAERAALAETLRAVLAPVGGRLIVAGPDPLGGDAVHLAAADPGTVAGLVGRSCHHAEDLTRLSNEDYITLSPVFPSPSKPGYGPPLGIDGLARLCARTAKPVYALGGVTSPDQAAACLAAGAYGVAVMGAVMRAADPGATVAALIEYLEGR